MSEQEQSANSPVKAQSPNRCGGRGRHWLVLLLVALLSGFAGAVTAHGFQYHHAFWGGAMMMGGPVDAADAEDRATWMAKQFARHIDATAEQKIKLTAIATAAVKDLLPLREKMIASRKQGIELLRQPTVSRDEIEKLRAEQIGNADTISKRVAQAIGDMMDVLTLEQRKELADDISHFARHWGGHRG